MGFTMMKSKVCCFSAIFKALSMYLSNNNPSIIMALKLTSFMVQNSPLKTVSKSGISLVHATVHRSKQISEDICMYVVVGSIDILVISNHLGSSGSL